MAARDACRDPQRPPPDSRRGDRRRRGFSVVGEPSLGIVADQILLTGNWYAARSLDRGATWSPLDPYAYLDPGPPTRFCCDQTVLYDAARDLMVWLLQYKKGMTDNTLRIAVKRGSTLGDDEWTWWDLSPADVHSEWTNEWFDYNHAATSSSHLFIGSNVFGLAGKRVFRSVVLRIPFASVESALTAGSALDLDYLEAGDAGTLRCAAGAGDTMYIAGQLERTQSGCSPGRTRIRHRRARTLPCRSGQTRLTRRPVRTDSTG